MKWQKNARVKKDFKNYGKSTIFYIEAVRSTQNIVLYLNHVIWASRLLYVVKIMNFINPSLIIHTSIRNLLYDVLYNFSRMRKSRRMYYSLILNWIVVKSQEHLCQKWNQKELLSRKGTFNPEKFLLLFYWTVCSTLSSSHIQCCYTNYVTFLSSFILVYLFFKRIIALF